MDKKKFWKNKTVFITGHTGFKGSWLTLLLNSLGAKVIGYSLNPISKPNFFDNLKLKNFLIRDCRSNILDYKKLKSEISKSRPSIIFHLAAQSSVLESYQNPINTVKSNIVGTSNVLDIIKGVNSIKSAVIVTTDKVYLNLEKKNKFKESARLGGFDLYSSSKASCEIIAESYIKSFFKKGNCKVATVRSGNCIGGGDWTKDRIIKDCVDSFSKNKKLVIRSPNATRPWQHVLEPLCGYLMLAKKLYYEKNQSKNKYVGAWNFGPNKLHNLKVKEVVKVGKKIFNSKSKIILKKKKYYESENLSLDSSKSLKYLNWKTRFNDNEAFKMTFNWYKNYYSKVSKEEIYKLSFDQIKKVLSKHKI